MDTLPQFSHKTVSNKIEWFIFDYWKWISYGTYDAKKVYYIRLQTKSVTSDCKPNSTFDPKGRYHMNSCLMNTVNNEM